MSTVDLPSYSGCPSHSDRTPPYSAPSYSAEPQRDELRIAVADRHRSLPSGNFIKESKGGGVILRLNAQEDNVELPEYGLGGQVTGTVELSKTEAVQSVEVKIQGMLLLNEIAGRGRDSANLCLNSMALWLKDTSSAQCPHSLRFALSLPSAFTYDGVTYPLPPSFYVKLSGLPGFIATIEYSVAAIVSKPHSIPIPSLNVKTLGIHFGTTIVSTPFVFYPRSRPAIPLPSPLQSFGTGLRPTPDWEILEYVLRSKSTARPDVVTKLFLPASRTYCISQPIPFYLSIESTASISLSAFLPFSPTSSNSPSRKITRVQLIRQSSVDIKHAVVDLAKGDIWRNDSIGEGTFSHAGDGHTWMAFSGQIVIDPTVKVTGFKAAGLNVKDCILFTITPPDASRSAFHELRKVVPVRLSTDPWAPSSVGIAI